ncbi:hypothetical protein MLD38_017794 [Melastoma candidum]|uniref:Uncharacterized protein n=1 Tax=Melastoma candidum TaxID=119954 RepID=A0ACB9QQZ2_9MYRT|nr:hypothetical protein MLD38_017794 [Melastoma candidum]
MGGNTKVVQNKSLSSTPTTNSPSFSILGLFKPVRRSSSSSSGRRVEDPQEDVIRTRKVRPSDYDKGRYVAEPGIDTKATAFIAKFHESQAVAAA